MKKTYLARRNALLGGWRWSWGTGALAFVLVLLVLRVGAPNVFLVGVAPILEASKAAGGVGSGFFAHFADAQALALENAALRSENAALSAENSALKEREREIANLVLSSEARVVGVVARPPVSPYDTLLVEGGERDGIESGMGAFGPGGVPIGFVSAVFNRFSRITLFSSSGLRTSALIKETSIQVEGKGGGAFAAMAPRTLGVEVGDVVYAAGPGKLPLGRVVRVDSDPTLTGVTLRIQGATNLFSLSWITLRDTGSILAP